MKRFLVLFLTTTLLLNVASALEFKEVEQQGSYSFTAGSGNAISSFYIKDIDTAKISQISVTADTYLMSITISNSGCLLFFTCSNISSYYKNLVTGQIEQYSGVANHLASSNAELRIAVYSYSWLTPYKIDDTSIGWASNPLLSGTSLINRNATVGTPIADLVRVPLSKNINVQIIGTDLVDYKYVEGMVSEQQSELVSEEAQDVVTWLLKRIPYVGQFILTSGAILVAFFTLAFTLISFLITDFPIIYLTFLTFTFIHAMFDIHMGGNLYTASNIVVRDHIAFIKFISWAIISVSTLIWRIVHAVATAIKAALPF